MNRLWKIKVALTILILALIPATLLFPGDRELALIILAAVGACVVLYLDVRTVTLPLLRLRESLKDRTTEEVLRDIAAERASAETGGLIRDVVERYTARQDAEISSRQIELAALQSQINPHFLYNTLDAIRGQAIQDNNREVAMMIQTLSAFFRYSISRKGNAVTLRDELDNVQNYMKIQQYRFGDRFHLELEVDSMQAYDYYVPRLIFQPIVENAILHGMEDIRSGGVITIDVEETDDLIIMISDNGKGMTLAELDRLNDRIMGGRQSEQRNHKPGENIPDGKHAGIALANVQNRISLLFGTPYGLHVYSSAGKGTDVEITLPIIRKEEEMSVE